MIDSTDMYLTLVDAARQEEKASLLHANALNLKKRAIELAREYDLTEEQIQAAIDSGVEAAHA